MVRVSLYSNSMERNALCGSSQHLVTVAHEHGYAVSMTQLGRWHRMGLLPHPLQQSRGKARGSQSLYPSGTEEQLLALCALHISERRLSFLAWQLWWAGYPVALPLIRFHLQEASIQLSQYVQFFMSIKQGEQTNDEVSERIVDFSEQFANVSLNYKPLRHARKRIGKENFPTFIRILLDILSDTFEGYDTTYDTREVMTELRIIAKGLGLHKLFINDEENLDYYIGKLFVPFLRQVGSWLRTFPWKQALTIATDFELLEVRDKIRTALIRTQHTFPYTKQLTRTYPVQSSMLREILQTTSVDEQAILLTLWLSIDISHDASHP